MGGCQGRKGAGVQWTFYFLLEGWKWLGTRQRRYLHNFVNVLSTTELYTLTWLLWWILCEFYHNKMMGNQKRNDFLKSIFKIVLNNLKLRSWHPISSLRTNRWGNSARFIFFCSKITADDDCSHEIKRCLLLGRTAMTNLHSILKSRDITLQQRSF